jgi:hypothetical protein
MSDTAQMTLDVPAAPEILVDLVDRPTLWSSLAHDAGLLADMDGLTDDEAAFQVSQAYIATCGGHARITTGFAARLYAKTLTAMRNAHRAAHLAN